MMISAVILTKNSSSSILRTLSSVSFCDEIIVIDDGSTDDTKNIVLSKHARFIAHPLNEDFATQRNFGLQEAKGAWVLFIDSDEVVTKELQHEIMHMINDKGLTINDRKLEIDKHDDSFIIHHKSLINGYSIKRQDIMWGKTLRHGETASVKLLRLARKDSGVWVRPVHEVWEVKGTVGELGSPLIHYPHATVREFLADVNRYSTMNAAVFHREDVRVNPIHIIVYPVGKFIQNYFVRFGFLDGMPGMIMAVMMSFHSFLTRGKLWELQRKNR